MGWRPILSWVVLCLVPVASDLGFRPPATLNRSSGYRKWIDGWMDFNPGLKKKITVIYCDYKSLVPRCKHLIGESEQQKPKSRTMVAWREVPANGGVSEEPQCPGGRWAGMHGDAGLPAMTPPSCTSGPEPHCSQRTNEWRRECQAPPPTFVHPHKLTKRGDRAC